MSAPPRAPYGKGAEITYYVVVGREDLDLEKRLPLVLRGKSLKPATLWDGTSFRPSACAPLHAPPLHLSYGRLRLKAAAVAPASSGSCSAACGGGCQPVEVAEPGEGAELGEGVAASAAARFRR